MIMKKNFISYACVATALVFASCQKEVQINNGTDALPSDLDEVTATILSTTRTVTEDGINVLWENGDKIGLRPFTEAETGTNQMVEYVTTLENNSPTATFVKAADCELSTAARNGKYIAFYPINPKYYMWSGKNEYITVGIRDYDKEKYEQILPLGGGWDDKSSLMIATSEDGTNFQFKHVMSYIKFTVDADSPEFDRVVITTNSGQDLTDRINVYYDGTYILNSRDSYRSSSVTLLTSEGAAFTPGAYYAALLPQTYTGGFKIAFYNANTLLGVKKIKDDVAFERGDVGNLGTIGQFTAADLPQLELATVFTENGQNQGVVYWVNPDRPYEGKIVSVCSSQKLLWAVSNDYKLGGTDLYNGLLNFEKVTTSQLYKENPANFPATKYCADLRETLGGNWYLPAISEFQTLYSAYYGLNITEFINNTDYRKDGDAIIDMQPKRKFDLALQGLGEQNNFATLDDDANADGNSDNSGFGTANGVQYWSSKENSNGPVQYIRFGNYSVGSTNRATERYVRCIRDVSLL